MDKVKVISSDIDGADLRKEKNRNKYFVRCYGKKDNEELNEALESIKSNKWSISGKMWDKIFGKKK